MTPVCWVIKRNPSYEPIKKVLFLIIGPPRMKPNSFWKSFFRHFHVQWWGTEASTEE